MLPYYHTPRGQTVVKLWMANVKRILPRLASEIEGLAAGLSTVAAQYDILPVDMVYLLNAQDEISQLANETTFAKRASKDHCMEYLVNTDSVHLHGHNEVYILPT